MKRPGSWLRTLLLLLVLCLLSAYALLNLWVPQYVEETLARISGMRVTLGQVTGSLPLTVVLRRLGLKSNTPEAALTVQQVLIQPAGYALSSKTLAVGRIRIEQPVFRLTRTNAGTTLWPELAVASDIGVRIAGAWAVPHTYLSPRIVQRIRIESLEVLNGTVDFIDQSHAVPFHGAIDHLSLVVGPLVMPHDGSQVSFAARGELLGAAGHAAPIYCSGWFDPAAKDLQASCQMDPLALAAFEPYYSHGPQVRPYGVTVKATSEWMAKANQMDAHIQVELNNLAEGDLSIHGRTIIDVKKMTQGREPRLRGELHVEGPLDDTSRWHTSFVPGDEPVQELIGKLLERGIEIVRLPLFWRKISVGIAPASAATIQGIEAASKEIREALEMLTAPIPGLAPEAAPPSPEAPAAVTEGPAVAPSGQSQAPAEHAPEVAPSTSAPQAAPAALPEAVPVEPAATTSQPEPSSGPPTTGGP